MWELDGVGYISFIAPWRVDNPNSDGSAPTPHTNNSVLENKAEERLQAGHQGLRTEETGQVLKGCLDLAIAHSLWRVVPSRTSLLFCLLEMKTYSSRKDDSFINSTW